MATKGHFFFHLLVHTRLIVIVYEKAKQDHCYWEEVLLHSPFFDKKGPVDRDCLALAIWSYKKRPSFFYPWLIASQSLFLQTRFLIQTLINFTTYGVTFLKQGSLNHSRRKLGNPRGFLALCPSVNRFFFILALFYSPYFKQFFKSTITTTLHTAKLSLFNGRRRRRKTISSWSCF